MPNFQRLEAGPDRTCHNGLGSIPPLLPAQFDSQFSMVVHPLPAPYLDLAQIRLRALDSALKFGPESDPRTWEPVIPEWIYSDPKGLANALWSAAVNGGYTPSNWAGLILSFKAQEHPSVQTVYETLRQVALGRTFCIWLDREQVLRQVYATPIRPWELPDVPRNVVQACRFLGALFLMKVVSPKAFFHVVKMILPYPKFPIAHPSLALQLDSERIYALHGLFVEAGDTLCRMPGVDLQCLRQHLALALEYILDMHPDAYPRLNMMSRLYRDIRRIVASTCALRPKPEVGQSTRFHSSSVRMRYFHPNERVMTNVTLHRAPWILRSCLRT